MVENINVRTFYHIACLASTIGLFCYCGWRYIQNESNALVDFRPFHREEIDIYPSFSICIDSIWNDQDSIKKGTGIYNATMLKSSYGVEVLNDYVHFLQGRYWNETMSKINYDDVTINLEDYLDLISISLKLCLASSTST